MSVANIATKIPADIADHIARNAGVILTDFSVEDWTVDLSKILGATSGGVTFEEDIEFVDYGEDIDNCPKNMMELKRIDSRSATLSGDMVSASAETMRSLAAAADIDGNKITPRAELGTEDFEELWYVCDYGNGGAIAIHMMNTLNTSGFAFEAKDREKGVFAFEYTAHYSMAEQDVVPYEIYIKPAA